MIFNDRKDAGIKLAHTLAQRGNFLGWEVVGLARGGVIVGAEIARTLSLPIASLSADDCHDGTHSLTVTGLGNIIEWPSSEEEGEARKILTDLGPLRSKKEVAKTITRVMEKQTLYNLGREVNVSGKKVILCDDGVVSGRSALSAIDALRHAGAEEIIFAVPVVPPRFPEEINSCEIFYYRRSRASFATGMFYFEFEDVPDEEVRQAIAA